MSPGLRPKVKPYRVGAVRSGYIVHPLAPRADGGEKTKHPSRARCRPRRRRCAVRAHPPGRHLNLQLYWYYYFAISLFVSQRTQHHKTHGVHVLNHHPPRHTPRALKWTHTLTHVRRKSLERRRGASIRCLITHAIVHRHYIEAPFTPSSPEPLGTCKPVGGSHQAPPCSPSAPPRAAASPPPACPCPSAAGPCW